MFQPNADWSHLPPFNPSVPMVNPFFMRSYHNALDFNWLAAINGSRRYPTPVISYGTVMPTQERNTVIRPIPTPSKRSSFSVDNLLSQFNPERPEIKTPQTPPSKCIELSIFEGTESTESGVQSSRSRRFDVYQREGPKITNDTHLNLPKELSLVQITVAECEYVGVYCFDENGIPSKIRYGPLSSRSSYIVPNEAESSNEQQENCWMRYVVTTFDENLSNLNKIFNEDKVLFETSKEIKHGEQLIVLEVLPLPPSSVRKSPNDKKLSFKDEHESVLPDSQSEGTNPGCSEQVDDQSSEGKGFQCERCGKVFSYKYYRDKHLKYTRCVDKGDRKYPCHLCSRSFEKRDRLRIHILHVHEKHRPHCCSVCGKRFSQSSSLNKHLRVHSGERPYKCVYCSKAFTASSILRTHIRQHSGEKPFKCKFCGKAFASHAAHDSHVRRTHTAPKPETHNCPLCKKSFQHSSHLKFHLQCIHGNWSLLPEREAPPVV